MRSASLLLALTIIGCSPGEVALHVDLKTDLVPSVEFVSVRTRVESADEAQRSLGETTIPADRNEDARYEGGVRVAELAVPAGTVQLTVELLDRAGDVVVGRRVLQSLSGTTAVRVVIARSCVGVMCPGAGDDPSATECAGRRCVPPECVTGEEPGCERECTLNTDCPAPADCAQAVCVDGACFAASDGTTCGAGMFCHSDRGCLDDPEAPDLDAGTLDAGTSDAGTSDAGEACGDCDDENPCTDDACGPSGCTHTNNAASCDDGVFCNGPDSCEGGACAAHAGSPCPGATVCSEADDTCTGCLADTDCPDPLPTSWGACGYAETCSESGTQSRDVTSWTCSAGTCVSDTVAESRACTRDTDGTTGCAATMTGTWGACGGFSGGACDETGTRSRSVTTYACSAGACAPSTTTEMGSCTRDTDGMTGCAATMTGTWGACGGFANMCDESGTRSRSVTSYSCAAGACAPSTTTETGSCTRDTDGATGCAATMTGTWSACGGFSNMCDESGTRSRSVTSYSCASGACAPSTTTETGSCTRDTDGMTGCAATVYGTWSACGGFSDVCDETGTRTRSVTTYSCGAGSCAPSTTTETGSCTRADTDGTSCGTTTYGTWGACGGFIGQCGEDGTRMRSMTTYVCGGGTCNGMSGTDTGACSRPSTDYDDCTMPFEFPCTVSYCLNGTCGRRGDTCGVAAPNCCEFGCRSGPCL